MLIIFNKYKNLFIDNANIIKLMKKEDLHHEEYFFVYGCY